MKIAIVAALPREIAPLVKGWPVSVRDNVHVYVKGNFVVACAGMGAARVTLAVEAALTQGSVLTLLSVGFAGACDRQKRIGDIIRPGAVIDVKTGARYSDSQCKDVLATVDVPASIAEKSRLSTSYHANAVDMEAATVLRLAAAHQIPDARAIKVISDEADFELSNTSRFITPEGQFREAAFALHTALRPRTWRKVIRLGRNAQLATKRLHKALEDEINWYKVRGY